MFGVIPSPSVALDRTPDQPGPLHLDRLAQALYYGSKQYLDADTWGPATYDQQHDVSRYTILARYLLARRAQRGPRPVDSSAFEQRVLADLDAVLRDSPGELVHGRQLQVSVVRAWLLDYYALPEPRADEVSRRWVALAAPHYQADALPY